MSAELEDDNARRRYRASAVLAYYRRRFDQREPVDVVTVDLVTDLMHFHAGRWDDVVRIAEGHYAEEKA